MAISPWDVSVELLSPDTAVLARYEGGEIAMGAPSGGTLVLSNGQSYASCNASMQWSDDSSYLAVPQWTPARHQRLMLIRISDGAVAYAAETYRVLQIESFVAGVVRGIDSPIHMSKPFACPIEEFVWSVA